MYTCVCMCGCMYVYGYKCLHFMCVHVYEGTMYVYAYMHVFCALGNIMSHRYKSTGMYTVFEHADYFWELQNIQ